MADSQKLFDEARARWSAGFMHEALALMGQAEEAGAAGDVFAYNFGTMHFGLRQFREAERYLRRSLEAAPDAPRTLNNLAAVLNDTGHPGEALALLERSIAIQPDLVHSWNNLGNSLKDHGRTSEAVGAYERALAIDPDFTASLSNLLLSLNYFSADGRMVRAMHELLCARLTEGAVAHYRKGSPVPREGRLSVGLLSPDLRQHPVAAFIEPLLRHADRTRVRLLCFSDTRVSDEVTERIRACAEVFHEVSALDDAALADRIASEGTHILIDCAGHTAKNRQSLFALRPAPLLATWLGYPATTGNPAIDFRITDAMSDPEGAEAFCTERLVRMNRPFLCFTPEASAPAVVPPPMLRNGHVTFGSFNNVPKLTPYAIGLWASVLHAVDGSVMALKSRQFADGPVRDRYLELFSQCGIGAERIRFLEPQVPLAQHHALYGEIDIALDTQPYSGTTTTCDALWMGVPVVSLRGPLHASRVSASILDAMGLGSFAASSEEAFVRAAVWLAEDPGRLAGLRAGLRSAFAASPLMDGKGFADAFVKLLLEQAGR